MSPLHPVSGPHTRAEVRVSYLMSRVMLALVPATLFGILAFGWPACYLLVTTITAAVLWEAACLLMAGKSPTRTVLDGSAALTGWLLALTLPPWAPWWIGVVGAGLAIVLGKQVYGGLGQNLFNPAMLARVTLLVSFPVEMTTWITPQGLFGAGSPGPVEALAITFGGAPPADGITGATFIGAVKTGFSEGQPLSATLVREDFDFLRATLGWTRGSFGETSSLLVLVGGVYLLRKRVISWHIPVSILVTVALLATLSHALHAERFADAGFHLASGALLFAAFFIATDYVTSPSSPAGQLVYGAGIGLITFVIRTFGVYPEGAGFAVLLMNAATPLIDHYLRPRIYGRDRRGKPLEFRR
ncbi:MAG TPA: RnfABCDGE type electron transport complex subunit D [Methylococcus sp.]|nr:RnfABCDGE type electron transport complex subunit D [Methylococcus sp.]